MDMMGTIDAYVKTEFLKKKMKTSTVTQKNNEGTFDQTFWLPVQWPMASDRIVLKVFDEDKVNDEIVCSMFLSLKQIVKYPDPMGQLFWANLYGAPLGKMGSNTERMNEEPEYASQWKGRILLHLHAEEVKNPEMKLAPLAPELKEYATHQRAYEQETFELMAEIGQGICLPGKETKYKIKVQINDFVWETDAPKEKKKGYCRWSQRSEGKKFTGPYKTLEELDRIYVYLMDGSDPICYWRGQVADFINPDPEFRWLPFINDLSIGAVSNGYEAGLVQVKMAVRHVSKMEREGTPVRDWKEYNAWKKPPPKRMSSYKIRCFIFQCKDIPSADSDGTSDPYISVWNPDNKEIKTKVVEDNLNPIFLETLEVQYEFEKFENAPPIVLNIWDSDMGVIDSDDYLGRCVIPVRKEFLILGLA